MTFIATTYQPGLVVLSFAVAIFASFVALDLVSSLAHARGWLRVLWLTAGSLAMGFGIWSMHFIGMLAFQMPGMTMSYDTSLMVASIVIAIVGSGFALSNMGRPSVSPVSLIASGFAMAAAIAGMHYLGMYSMRMHARIEWNSLLVAVSLLIALAASFSALIVAKRLPTTQNPLRTQVFASVLLGFAIAGMHYAGMEAAEFYHLETAFNKHRSVLASSELTILVVAGTMLILLLALSGSAIDRMLTKRALREREHARKAHEAETANALKTRFLANMSHEIRTPLGAIIGFTELILEEPLEEKEQREYLLTVLRSARALSTLLDDVLDLSKIEMNKLEIENRIFALRPYLQEILDMFKVKADPKGLILKLVVDEKLPVLIRTDSNRLRQILVNLIGNAVKFTTAGYVRIEARRETQNGAESLAIEVEDSGIGLTQEQAARLFQPFTQADSSTTRKYGGTGLGLDISRRIANALGGDVRILKSAPNLGTTFLARVRLEVPEQQGSEGLPFAVSNSASKLKDLRVLLVEDNHDNQILMQRILRRSGASVTIAENGRAGVDAAREKTFDVILMDIQMPIMNGYEAIKELRALGSLPLLP